jgi:hypothetical protein
MKMNAGVFFVVLLFVFISVPARAQTPRVEGVPVKVGDTLKDVETIYSTTVETETDVTGPQPLEKRLDLKSKGVLVIFDKYDRVASIRLEAPFPGDVSGVRIGDSRSAVERVLGPPAKMNFTHQSYNVKTMSYDYYFDETTTTRLSFNPADKLEAITLFQE